MMISMLLAAAITVTPIAPVPEAGLSNADARTIVGRQLTSPPRSDAASGLSADEADMIMKKYLASIGQRLSPVDDDRPR